MQEIMKKLQEPFAPDDIEWRVGSTNKDKTKGLALAYVTNRAIMNRLDEVFGSFGWQNQFREWKNNSQICGISVWNEDKKEWVTKWDGADDSKTEAVKGGLSDSMKRAAVQWGIGRYLYNLPSQWCKIKQFGSSYTLDETPRLPEWALPESHKNTKTASSEKSTETKQPQGNGLKWETFWNNVKAFGLNKDQVLVIASEIRGHQVTDITKIITSQNELNKFTAEIRKRSRERFTDG